MQDSVLLGKRVYFFGKLAGATRRSAAQLVRQWGGTVVTTLDSDVNLVVMGEADLLTRDFVIWTEQLDAQTKEAFEQGKLDILSESAFWSLLSESEGDQERPPLFTAAMLAESVGLPIATIRLWQRRGLIIPAKMVRNLAYFDFQEVLTAKTLRDLLRDGLSPDLIEKRLQSLQKYFPNIARPLSQLALIVEGKDVLLRKGERLIDQKGQNRIDFDALENGDVVHDIFDKNGSFEKDAWESNGVGMVELNDTTKQKSGSDGFLRCLDIAMTPQGPDASTLCETALALEEEGRLSESLALFRAALAAEGPDSQICFQVAELLYRLGDLTAARERYYMVLELDEEDVEARANLGCVLAETGETDLAVAAFQGTLKYHPDYADVHYHLGMLLWRQGRKNEAIHHLEAFLVLHPDSPWGDQVREMLNCTTPAQ